MRNPLTFISALMAMLTLSTPVTGAQSTPPASDTFTWLSELVAVDTATRTLTVKCRVAYQEALAALKQFKAGDPVLVVWSGVNDYSDAVREFRRRDASAAVAERLVVPAELVSPDATNQYVTLRVRVPDTTLADIKNVKPGEWLTVTSRQHPGPTTESVVRVKPYSQSTPSTTTN